MIEFFLVDDDVYVVADGEVELLVIHVPRAEYNLKPIYVGENPYKGTFKRNNEGDYHGGISKARNPKMQTMLRMVGFGDNAGSGFPAILETWKSNGWVEPELIENTVLNQVTLVLSFEEASEKAIGKNHRKEKDCQNN